MGRPCTPHTFLSCQQLQQVDNSISLRGIHHVFALPGQKPHPFHCLRGPQEGRRHGRRTSPAVLHPFQNTLLLGVQTLKEGDVHELRR